MALAAAQLADLGSRPVTVTRHASASDAYRIMMERNFSQLPVVDASGVPVGMLTLRALLRATQQVGADLSRVRVEELQPEKPRLFKSDDALFEMLDGLREESAVLVVDGAGVPHRIVTHHDATEFFRRHAEEVLWLQSRNRAREQKYDEFFSSLRQHLGQSYHSPAGTREPRGRSWVTLLRATRHRVRLNLAFAFTLKRTSRVELHVDAPDREQSKRVFDALLERRPEIEAELGAPLSWEREDRLRECRIALYNDGFVTGDEAQTRKLREWATTWIPAFEKVLCERALAACELGR